MSRVGKLPIPIPAGVRIQQEGNRVIVQGPKGTLEHPCAPEVDVAVADGRLEVRRKDDSRRARELHGLTRRLIANLVTGVSQGFTRVLEIHGVGYRAEVKGNAIHLALGYSHPIVFQLPQGVQAKVDRQTVITLESSDKHLIGQTAAMIRELRPPEPYKGKGVKYAEEQIRRKAGKAAGAAS
ncbi:MAG: large subunit ribosomal protein [Candidatus Binatota bacterium]|jgi:large subunit ribosomal protein L6|nr:large subunit ribosomal protein [Candidatus Binatota bacterium]